MNLKEFIFIVVLLLNQKLSMGYSHTVSNEVRAEIGGKLTQIILSISRHSIHSLRYDVA